MKKLCYRCQFDGSDATTNPQLTRRLRTIYERKR